MQVSAEGLVMVALMAVFFYHFSKKITVLENNIKKDIQKQAILLEKELNRLILIQEGKLSMKVESLQQELLSKLMSLENDQQTRMNSLITGMNAKISSMMNELQSLRWTQYLFMVEMRHLATGHSEPQRNKELNIIHVLKYFTEKITTAFQFGVRGLLG